MKSYLIFTLFLFLNIGCGSIEQNIHNRRMQNLFSMIVKTSLATQSFNSCREETGLAPSSKELQVEILVENGNYVLTDIDFINNQKDSEKFKICLDVFKITFNTAGHDLKIVTHDRLLLTPEGGLFMGTLNLDQQRVELKLLDTDPKVPDSTIQFNYNLNPPSIR